MGISQMAGFLVGIAQMAGFLMGIAQMPGFLVGSAQRICGYIDRVMRLQLYQITDDEPPCPKNLWLYRPCHEIAAASDY